MTILGTCVLYLSPTDIETAHIIDIDMLNVRHIMGAGNCSVDGLA